ncbi:unnamed protein product [Linum trigynum]|uniref:Uncharacterized protein n=1 Tax=Linum trigynum TaxID=586398 RepID=A0AAV2EDF8_9ROSI
MVKTTTMEDEDRAMEPLLRLRAQITTERGSLSSWSCGSPTTGESSMDCWSELRRRVKPKKRARGRSRVPDGQKSKTGSSGSNG